MTRVHTTTRNPSSRSVAPILLLSACLLATGCGPASDQPAEGTSDTPAVPRLEPIATFGCDECKGPEQLSEARVNVGASGRIYVIDMRAPFVRVLTSDGEFLMTVGESGDGPGEIRSPVVLGVAEDPEGGFWVYEAAWRHHFADDGNFVQSEPYSIQLPMSFAFDHRKGAMYMYASQMPGSSPARRGVRKLIRYEPGESDATTVLGSEHFPANPDGSNGNSPWIEIALVPDGRIVLADAWTYEIQILDPDSGSVAGGLDRTDLTRPLKSEEQLERERENNRRFGRPDRQPNPELPYFSQLTVDGSGRMWLATYRGQGTLDVISPDGKLLTETSLGERIFAGGNGLNAGGDRLVAVTLDDLDTPTVRIFRIVDE